MDIRKLSVEETSFLHLRDANDELLYEPGANGEPDESKPVGVTLYGPGTKAYAKATAAKSNRMIDRLKKKGKSDLSADEATQENAAFLAACTKEFRYIERDSLDGEALYKAVYGDASVGFISEQAAKHLGEWANFKPASSKN